MSTKRKGDIAEIATALSAMRKGWNVLQPIGDRLPYDLVIEAAGTFIKIQVKAAWRCDKSKCWKVDNRRTKTNRRVMKREGYSAKDFDFAVVYLIEVDVFYVMPVEVFVSYGGPISFIEGAKRQRTPRADKYRDAWDLITTFARHGNSNPVPATN